MGAGLGALGGLLTGNDPIKGAALGGATGGLLGGLPAGAWGGGSAGVAGGSTSPLSAGSLFNGIGTNAMAGGDIGAGLAMNASMAAPSLMSAAPTASYAAGASPAAFLAPTGQEVGMANAFNMATNAPTGLAAQTFGAENAMLSNPIMGGIIPLSEANYAQIASNPAS